MSDEKQAGSDKDAGQEKQQGQGEEDKGPPLQQPEALDVKDAGAGIGGSATETPAPSLLGSQTFAPAAAAQTTAASPAPSPAQPGPAAGGREVLTGSASPGQAMSPAVAAADMRAAGEAQPPAQTPTAPPAEAAQTGVGQRAAALIRDQMDVLVLRIFADTQELLEVAAAPPDPVTIRTVLETMASAFERGDGRTFAYTYSRTARPVHQQINDQVLPFGLGLQVGGMFEAILRDTFDQGFASDPALRSASVGLLAEMAAPAKRALLGEPSVLVQWQAPRI
ncbi:MAG: hypothetical protein ACR2M0_13310 [Chloroflexia bacterium]